MGKDTKGLLEKIREAATEIAQIKIVRPCNFSDPKDPHFLKLQFYGNETEIQKLITDINNQIGDRNAQAYLQWEDTQPGSNGNVKYFTVIFPHDHIPKNREYLQKATDSFMERLPHTIRNYACYYGKRHR